MLNRETLAKGKPWWGWNPQDDSLYKRIWLRILTRLGVYEECIASWVLVRWLGLVICLNPISSCFNPFRSWWIIYIFMHEELISLTCNYTISILQKNENTSNTFTCYSISNHTSDLTSHNLFISFHITSHDHIPTSNYLHNIRSLLISCKL